MAVRSKATTKSAVESDATTVASGNSSVDEVKTTAKTTKKVEPLHDSDEIEVVYLI